MKRDEHVQMVFFIIVYEKSFFFISFHLFLTSFVQLTIF